VGKVKNVLFLHLVTTDNKPDTCELVQVAGELVRMDEARTSQAFLYHVRPSGVMTPEASAASGWSTAQAHELPEISLDELAEALGPFFRRAGYLCAHGGLSFHFRTLYKAFREQGLLKGFTKRTVFDTYLMTKKQYPDLPSYQLRALAFRFGVPEMVSSIPELTVDPMRLIGATRRVWERVVFEAFGAQVDDDTLAEINRWQYEPPTPTVFSFGPYRGQAFTKVFQESPGVLKYYMDLGWVARKYPGDYQAMLKTLKGDVS
jgi:hypothetical protein